jgi:serine/threonine protein phosphatase 1
VSAQDHFETLPAGRRNWAVAAIHGEADRLRALHRRLAERIQVGENLVYLGNFLGRGDAVAETIEELLLFRRALLARPGAEYDDIVYLRGSQEEMWHKLLQIQFAPNPGEVLEWMLEQGVAPTLAAYGGTVEKARSAANGGALVMTKWTSSLRAVMRAADGHTMLMSVLRRAAFTEDKALLFVHAGIDATRPLSEQHDSFWWGGEDFDNIEAPYGGFRRVVRGFDRRHRGLEVKAATATVDGACGFGGPLLAACFDADGELVDTIEA